LAAAVCALVALTGCFGRGGGGPSPSPSSSTPHPGERGVDGQRVVFAKGADVEAGMLVKICEGSACTAVPREGTVGRFTVAEPRPILSVTFELEPDAVQGIVMVDGRRSEPTDLDPGTLVAWRPLVTPGLSELRIVATYGTQRLEWACTIVRA
jgi:hypothetical protein